MKFLKVTPKGYTFQQGRGRILLPRVSQILEWKYGPMRGDPDNLRLLAKFGTMVHESIDRKTPLPGTEAYVSGAHAFMHMTGFKTVSKEQIVFSKRYQYAGRVDRIGTGPKGGYILVDWKSGGFGERGQVQMNLYDMALAEMGIMITTLYGVELNGKGFKAKKVEKNWAKAIEIVREYHISKGGNNNE